MASSQVAAPSMASVRPVPCAFKSGVQRPSRGVSARAAGSMTAPIQQVLPPLGRAIPDQERTQEPLVLQGMSKKEQTQLLQLPKLYHWYETMLILNPNLNDEERDRELAKFEAFLTKEECLSINALVRGRTRMAYNIKKHSEGIYVLYTYAARRQTAKAIQKLLSTPGVGTEENIMRHITFCKY
eukprot:CAMPEP_0119102076 /NCGR_PEP_ID=MMETSP1180-20130426/942_1 /TAXON_ID=3052 ORGANISM="Chlamydomonas cf sp, Strain CCMP681" /NCGR_SAMPLE_ID=MMETSP1180 /ASSEMBLY_ACC=CAM_ASM_000741 /LENGTH=183 /DNA_ID=CAMNT_0007086301 /DNA_START=71 /DNA_END=622 /DNA_ORIENTATION=-